MNNYTMVALTEDIPKGKRKRIEVKGQRISLFNVN
ncbi:uncharacterized protein METZ01_LOCUS474845, partial [marine metagenome]